MARPGFHSAALGMWLTFLVALVYGRALQLPFFADDFFQLPFVDAHRLTELWLQAEGLFYFRPFAFTVWKLFYLIQGEYSPPSFHALNLVLHLVNGLLVAWLVGQLWAPGDASEQTLFWLRRFLSATLFILFPFSYEAVSWVAAVMHPMMLFFVLLAVGGYLQWSASGSRWWLAASLLATLLAPFAHENGALLFALLVAVALLQPDGAGSFRSRKRLVLLWTIPAMMWFVVWQRVPAADGAGTLALNDLHTIGRNSLYIAQGVAYPFSWVGGGLRDDLSIDGWYVALLLSALALILVIGVQWRQRERLDRRAFLPWMWTAIAVAPAILFLPYEHISAGPRILMLGSVGIVWLWTEVILCLLPSAPLDHTRTRALRISLPAACVVGLLVQNMLFVNSQMRIYELGGGAIWQAAQATMAANAAGQKAVFINFPSWIAPPRATYALGQEGDIFVLSAEQVDDMVWAHTGESPDVAVFDYADIRAETRYHSGVLSAEPNWEQWNASGARLFVTRYEQAAIHLDAVGKLGLPNKEATRQARFGSAISLEAATAEGGDRWARVNLSWRVLNPVPAGVTVFVHVLDANGQLVGQADGDPLGGVYPFGRWPMGAVINDQRVVHVEGKPHTIHVGLYERASGARLPVVTAEGARSEADAIVVPVSIPPESQPILLP